ncbi:MAG: serine/threonine protein kinase, partial [Planctomycetia bacterium]|nr:serine/threonine protein kinase [Planctomycetia bacterium]
VIRSKLMTQDEVKTVLRTLPSAHRDDPKQLADHLVRSGKLTRFQTSKLIRGIYQGLVIGPFRILAPLGRGGMGTVFLVRDSRESRLAALKILPPRLAKESRMKARFQREMEMCRKVSHPNLAEAYDVGEYRGIHYIAMEFIPGRTLSRMITEEGQLDPARAARLFAEVADALHHAHGQGVIHRDLKPGNILIMPNDVPKVVDLGLALMHGESGEDAEVIGGKGYIVGTMDFIAPEQTTNAARVGPRVDLYSLGCTMYFALSGRLPFPGGTSKEKVKRHRNEEPTPLAWLRPGLPEGFVTLIERLMSKDPEGRPANAQETANELRKWAGANHSVVDLGDSNRILEQMVNPGPGSSEYSQVSLPEYQELVELPAVRPLFPTWLIVLLGVFASVLVVGAIVGL